MQADVLVRPLHGRPAALWGSGTSLMEGEPMTEKTTNRNDTSEEMLRSRKRSAALWNTASGMLNAGQSALILIFISHRLDMETAGIFTIAYALANLFFMMGKYGIRNYQVTDVYERYAFPEYLRSRVYSCAGVILLMLLYLAVQVARGAYSPSKALIVVFISLWKLVDAVEDVYYGMYQQKGRLDIGARCYTLRLGFSTVVFCLLIFLKLPFLLTTAMVMLVSILGAGFFISKTYPGFGIKKQRIENPHVMQLMRICFPLFVGYSLSTFVGNSPKYMIDWYLTEEVQAVFGYIMMPAFVILVLSQVIYQPIIKDMGELWAAGNKKKFNAYVIRQYGIVAVLTGVVVLGGSLLGIPVLSWFYNTDLAPYKWEFIILLIGGGVYAVSNFLLVPLTTIRFQQCVAFGFGIVTVLSLALGKYFVTGYGVMGAAILYLLLNSVLAIFFTGCYFWKLRTAEPEVVREE